MKFKTTLLIFTALVFCAGLSRSVMACPGITLPAASTGNTMSFGDALVYSLPILGVSGQTSDCIVVALDSNGALVGFNAGGSDYYVSGGSPNLRAGDPSSSTDSGQVLESNGGAAITWDGMLAAIRGFLANRPILPNFGAPGNQTRTNTDSQNGGAVTSDAIAAGGDTAPAGGDTAPAGGDAGPTGSGILPAANAVVSPELNTLLDLANFDVAAVPEPGTLVLFGMGLLVLGLWQVRRRRH